MMILTSSPFACLSSTRLAIRLSTKLAIRLSTELAIRPMAPWAPMRHSDAVEWFDHNNPQGEGN